MSKAPLALVKERFTNKEGLIAAVKALATDDLWTDRRLNSDKGLEHVSNKKLLHLHDVLSAVKKDHGSRAKLIDALVEGGKRSKDAGYRTRLERASTPELFEQLSVQKRRTKQAEAKAAPKAKTKSVAPKAKAAPKAKKAAPKKTIAKTTKAKSIAAAKTKSKK
jgi:hypothetical protein